MSAIETGSAWSSRKLRLMHGQACTALALALAIALPGVAHAAAGEQAAPPADAAEVPANDGQLTDIIVTARRVTERLQDIPASVSAVTGDQVAQMNSLADIQSMVSGVTFKTFGPIPTVGIRGYGNRTVAGSNTNSTVGVFQDGAFVAPALVVLANRVDSGRIEVAKGPQSTLYGRSSFTGAINIVSNDPDKTFSGYIDAGYGGSSVHGEDLWHVRGAVSVPLSDTLSVRFFGAREKRDGYTYDSVTGNRGNSYDRKIGRVRIRWEPSEFVTARLTGTILRDNLPLGQVHTGRNPAPLGQGVILGNPRNPAVQTALQFGENVWDAQYVLPQIGKTRGEQATLDLRFQTPMGELASLTDYQHSNQYISTSIDLTRLNLARGDNRIDEDRWSQELRLSNKVGRLSYLLGLYYLRSVTQTSGGKKLDLAHPSNTFGPGSVLFDLLGRKFSYSPAYNTVDAYAAFGQLGYDITDKLNLTVGLRQSRDELSGETFSFFGTVAGALIPSTPFTRRKVGFSATTGSANLSYKIAPDAIAYGSYSRGNSPGGFNGGGAGLLPFGPQNVDAFEVGLKSQLLDRHLQLNVALFDNEYGDLQLNRFTILNGVLTQLTTNAGKARGRGIDLDAVAVLSGNWRLGLQYTYVDSKITHYILPPLPAPQVDLTGVPLVRSPRHSLNGSVTFTQDVGPGNFKFTAEESYSSSYTNDYQGVPAGTAYPGRPGVPAGVTTTQVLALYRTPGYAVTNLNASYTWNQWQLSGYVRNLFNHQYVAGVLGFDAVNYPQELPGEPRTFELSVKYSF
ncbi:MAG TPA: TonB-dependent receptor [Novosphingobium sp.]|nr:TonB-dependent receptor [Novosphingobium sp.]